MEFVSSILYRKVNPSDFKKLYGIGVPETGGGQTYLEVAGIDNDALTSFLSIGEVSDRAREGETRHIYTINAYILGKPDEPAEKLEFDPRSNRNNYKISRQTIRDKHSAWKVENGFPEPNRDEGGNYQQIGDFAGIIDHLTILIIRSSYNKYYASFLNSESIPEQWPTEIGLEKIFAGERRGVLTFPPETIPFENSKEQPFGAPLAFPVRVTGGRNILLYGVPGSGKSKIVDDEYCKDCEETQIERLVFHPDYTYSDFVGQILPIVSDGNVSYEFTAGPFTRLLKKACDNPTEKYFLIVEEINRGNASAIFGEVFQLLDRNESLDLDESDGESDGESEYGISNVDISRIIYDDDATKIRIPSNMYIIGTMNTSDQNVFTLDTAFQRRWSMRMIKNDLNKVPYADNKILDTDVSWKDFVTAMNLFILKKNVGVTSSEDKRLGAFFVRKADLVFDTKEDDATVTPEEKAAATLQNSSFPEKILKYLWDDAFKFYRKDIFETSDFLSLEDIIGAFCKARGRDRFLVFKEEIRESFSRSGDGE
jgi:hypothetical protein